MASFSEVDREARRGVVTAVLRSVRMARGLKVQDMAEALRIEPRSYERFEAGEVQLDLDRLLRFADVTDSDPVALFASIVLERPELALRCLDTKLALIQLLALEQFVQQRDATAGLPNGATFISVMEGAFEELGKELLAQRRFARSWLDGVLKRPKSGS